MYSAAYFDLVFLLSDKAGNLSGLKGTAAGVIVLMQGGTRGQGFSVLFCFARICKKGFSEKKNLA